MILDNCLEVYPKNNNTPRGLVFLPEGPAGEVLFGGRGLTDGKIVLVEMLDESLKCREMFGRHPQNGREKFWTKNTNPSIRELPKSNNGS